MTIYDADGFGTMRVGLRADIAEWPHLQVWQITSVRTLVV